MKKIIFLILDGLGDRPVEKLGGKTPLEAAQTPNMDKLAEKGAKGFLKPTFNEGFPTSVEGHLSLFGYDINKMNAHRGPFEALGIGLKLQEGDVVLRVNFATVNSDFKILDRRAGRIKDTSQLAQALNDIKIKGVEFLVDDSTSHRSVLVLRGKGVSDKIIGGDKHKINVKVSKVEAEDESKEAEFTADVLNQFLSKAYQILKVHPINKEREKQGLLPANYLLTREPGRKPNLIKFQDKWKLKAICLAGGRLYKGIGRALGMTTENVPGATGKADTNIAEKFKTAVSALREKYQFCFLHIKATDVFSHDGDCLGKKKFIEKIDKNLPMLLENKETILVITGDHCTPCEVGEHTGEPVPFIICPSPVGLTGKTIKMTELLPKLIEFARLEK